jgi:polysaccharide transporter, PST family
MGNCVDSCLKRNVIALTLLQMGNYLVPLLVMPYLTRVLGPEGFGQLGFVTAFIAYFVIVTDWGFNLSATQKISLVRHNRAERSLVFWETLFSRVLLAFLSILVLVVLVLIVPRLTEVLSLLIIGMLQLLASVMSSAFYYQGVERMGQMALINFLMKASAIPLIFIWVTDQDQLIRAFGIQCTCIFFASLLNIYLLLRSGDVFWIKPTKQHIQSALNMGFPLFISAAGISLYTNSNAVILGFVSTAAEVGFFVAGFAIAKAVVGLSGPLGQAFFPRVSLNLSSGNEASVFLRKMIKTQIIFGALLSVGLLGFSLVGVEWFFGEQFNNAVLVTFILSLLPLIICIASALGMQTLVPYGRTRWFTTTLLLGGGVNCLLLLPLGSLWGATGAAIAVIITELLIMVGMIMGVKKLEPKLWAALLTKGSQ